MGMSIIRWPTSLAVVSLATLAILFTLQSQGNARHGELSNRIPEAAPYNTSEARQSPPPYETHWASINHPKLCAGCHVRIFAEWNGSMMANSWRDPGWKGAFLLLSRMTATDGNCDIPEPPDGTPKARLNPFANGDCSSTFDLGTTTQTTTGSGSLLDDFCSRCHMPTNYVDQVRLSQVTRDVPSGRQHGAVRPSFDPTSANGTDTAFATVETATRNTESGQMGVTCAICHTYVASRDTPYHNHERTGVAYSPALRAGARDAQIPAPLQEIFQAPNDQKPNLGWGIGSGSYQLSPHAIVTPERFGPLTIQNHTTQLDLYVSDTFNTEIARQQGEFSIHKGYYHVMFERSEYCSACHDVTNPLTIKNPSGKWVGGFPIERTYTEWLGSRYADRPDNIDFDPRFKRDCQTCHMQQDYGQPGTAKTLYQGAKPVAPIASKVWQGGRVRPAYFSHHFIGGNAHITRLIGATLDAQQRIAAYPKLSTYSFSSASKTSPYANAYWDTTDSGPVSQHSRMAWDRLRHVLTLTLSGPKHAAADTVQPLRLRVTNTGSGHKFPTGFPEGRVAWVAVRAFDLASQTELAIYDAVWNRVSIGVGYLTNREMIDPNFPGCKWVLPAGSPDPYALQMKAVASLGDGCPTLALPYAAPLNLVVNANGMPIDANGKVIDRNHPTGKPQFVDYDGDGDIYDDAYLSDTRLRPLPHPGATIELNRYHLVIPPGTKGPVAITALIYYQSFEAAVAKKLLGNLADTDLDGTLEPCVLKGACDGRIATGNPPVAEGAPPIPMTIQNWTIAIDGAPDTSPPTVALSPVTERAGVPSDVVVKAMFSEPVRGLDTTTLTLRDQEGNLVPARVDQIDNYTWGLFPNEIFLSPGGIYTAHLKGLICDYNDQCLNREYVSHFAIAKKSETTK